MPDLILYGTPLSGHSHRVELLLRQLALPYQFRPAPDTVRRSAEFRALNPLGQIPVLIDGDLVLADSQAILVYLARRYDPSGRWYPVAPAAAARVQRWLSIAAGEIRYGPAAARLICLFGDKGDLAAAQALAARFLPVMDGHLAGRAFLADDALADQATAGSGPTIADLACYGYIARAGDGGIALAPFGHITAWLARIEALPGFLPLGGAPAV